MNIAIAAARFFRKSINWPESVSIAKCTIPLPKSIKSCKKRIKSTDGTEREFVVLYEEVLELRQALESGSKEDVLQELTDVVYASLGMSATLGLPLVEAFTAVHMANLSKTPIGKAPGYTKEATFQPASMEQVLSRQKPIHDNHKTFAQRMSEENARLRSRINELEASKPEA